MYETIQRLEAMLASLSEKINDGNERKAIIDETLKKMEVQLEKNLVSVIRSKINNG